MATFENARAFDDPVGVEAQALVEVIVGDNGVGNVAAGAYNAHAGQAAAARTWQRRSLIAHEIHRRLGAVGRPKPRNQGVPS